MSEDLSIQARLRKTDLNCPEFHWAIGRAFNLPVNIQGGPSGRQSAISQLIWILGVPRMMINIFFNICLVFSNGLKNGWKIPIFTQLLACFSSLVTFLWRQVAPANFYTLETSYWYIFTFVALNFDFWQLVWKMGQKFELSLSYMLAFEVLWLSTCGQQHLETFTPWRWHLWLTTL